MTRPSIPVVAALLFSASLAQGEEASPRAIREDHPGYALYRQYCASCHGVFADGLGPVVPTLRTRPPDLTRLAEKYGRPLPRPALISYIGGTMMVRGHGTTDMPVWGTRIYADLPPTTATEASKRMTMDLIVDYLDALQRSE